MYPLALLMADFINKSFLKGNSKMYDRFAGPKELAVIQRLSHCQDSFAVTRFRYIKVLFHISYYQSEVRKTVPCTENFVISRFHCIDEQHRRLATLQNQEYLHRGFFFFTYSLFSLTLFIIIFSFYLIIIFLKCNYSQSCLKCFVP